MAGRSAGAAAAVPLIFAHRGSSELLPEHTLAAYRHAIEEGSDGLECDVRLTRDGHLVCVHDRRLDRTSSGTGLVSAHTLAELDLLDFGSWHAPPSSEDLPTDVPVDPDRTRLLTLDRLLEEVRAADRPLELLVETKHPSRYRGAVERSLVTLLHRHGLAEPRPVDPVRVTIMSFSPLAVRRVRDLAPRLPTAFLIEAMPRVLRVGRMPFGAQIAGLGIALVRARPQLVPALRAAGNRVYVWTVNELADLDLVLEQGVDGVITNRPATMLQHLGR